MFDSREFRNVLGHFATGITVVTGVMGDGKATGVTVNSFSSLSLDPPLVLICLDKNTKSLDAYTERCCFVVHVLADDQIDLSNRFAAVGEEKMVGIDHDEWGNDCCPVLKDCLAVIKCHREMVYDGGDHVIIVGRVSEFDADPDKKPLLYYKGQYQTLTD